MKLAVDVGNAALMEVGIDPVLFAAPDLYMPGRVTIPTPLDPTYQRAAVIGIFAEYGPDVLVRCLTCREAFRCEPCTPVRDALRGFTCGPQP